MRLVLPLMIGFTLLVGCSRENTKPADRGEVEPSQRDRNLEESVDTPEMHAYPSPKSWEHANDRQRKRALRSFDQLKERNAPVYPGPLFVDDDEEVTLQSPQDVARRTLVLWAVELRAEGISQEEAIELIEGLELWDSVSPEEKRFLQDDDPDPTESQELVWRLESIWVLLWALGYVEELNWPSGMCDVPRLVEILKPNESNPAFITDAKLRSKAEILDAQDLIMRIHWAIRDAHLNHGGIIPDDLDWSQDYNAVSVTMSAAVGVVDQRHYTLNWLVKFLKPKDWDHVDTPT
ncbi:DUF4272 domain-containing protein [Lignipirellula cremea]|uniref:DUF4272 domain-containing protein n=1 Tax=Lignipirellula cremea TaxID=2528010 RepID=A0A518DS70_9BACT|nr:DUF4272 domain-containing protein [Lignipirellula cremea]QDU94683.1 hypothetical protein Pla8534_24890 [Lignipirellula cremea]